MLNTATVDTATTTRLDTATTARLTRAERASAGRALRAAVPRSSHAELAPARPNRDPVSLLESQNTTRLPDLLPYRRARMAASPFSFFRGAALVMTDDLAGTPRTGLTVQACGDAHLSNFGVFASPERRLVFDINDFDESAPGPWEWDVKRLAASIEVAGRQNGHSDRQRRRCTEAAAGTYRRTVRDLGTQPALDVWYLHVTGDQLAARFATAQRPTRRSHTARALDKARSRNNLGALRRFVDLSDAQPRLRAEPPFVVPIRDIASEDGDTDTIVSDLADLLARYRETLEPERRVLLDRYRPVDAARKVVGVGSVGTRCWMLLLLGDNERDPLFLQAKEAGPSVLEGYLGSAGFTNAGQRVVVGQRLMQTVSDIFLGWVRVTGFDGQERDFYLRQLRDGKGSAEVEAFGPPDLLAYSQLCAWTLARAHARSGDPVAIGAYLGGSSAFDVAIGEFARHYADRNAADHAALVSAITSGRLAATIDGRDG